MNAFQSFFQLTSPFMIVMGMGCLLVFLEGFKVPNSIKSGLSLIGVALSIIASLCLVKIAREPISPFQSISEPWFQEFYKSYSITPHNLILYAFIGIFAFVAILSFRSYFARHTAFGEILILTLFVTSGLQLLITSNSLLMLFLSLELFSLPTYVLVGAHRKNKHSTEAALKYFLFGSFATVLLLLAIALLYAQFTTLSIPQLAELLSKSEPSVLSLGAMVLFSVAVLFKVGIVPFHMWVPDVYQGAPAPITGFMGSAIKMAGFVLVTKVLGELFYSYLLYWSSWLQALAILTMFVGNLAALAQDNLKRMFAYSSVAHAGYLLLALLSFSKGNQGALYYYLIVYGLMFVGLFSILGILEHSNKNTEIYEISGLGFSRPLVGLCLTIFALSAAGIPPTAGFFAKYFLFLEAVKNGKTFLILLAVLSSLIGVYFYLRVIVYTYMKEPRETIAVTKNQTALILGILLCALALFYFAFCPSLLTLMS